MKPIILFLAILVALLHAPVWADSEKTFTVDQVKQFQTNNSFAFLDMNAIGALFSLAHLRDEDNSVVLEILEYQLDVIVCSTWDMKDKLNAPSKERALKILRSIKEYREKNPRKIEAELAASDVKEIIPGAIESEIAYTDRATSILAGLE